MPHMPQLEVQLGRLRLANPIMVASGTFGYAREMAGLVDLRRLGAIVPKTITPLPRAGNPPPRTVETAAGMLNSPSDWTTTASKPSLAINCRIWQAWACLSS